MSQTDVLFKAQFEGKPVYFYILAEHESQVDSLIAFWLMKYMISIWDYHIKQHPGNKALPLPFILPLVFYTGGGDYNAQRQFWKLFGDHSLLMKETLEYPFHLIEVDKLPEKAMTSHIFAGTMAFIMRKHFRTHLNQEIRKIISNLNALEHCEHHRFVLELIKYMLNIDEKHTNINELLDILQNQMSPAVEKEIMSLAEKLIEQGIEKGKLEGKLDGIREGEQKKEIEIAERMLVEGSEPVFIAKVTGLSIEQIKKLGRH